MPQIERVGQNGQTEEKMLIPIKKRFMFKKSIRGIQSEGSKILTGVHWSNSGLLVEAIENKFVLICCIFWQCLGFLSVLLKFLLQRPAQFVTSINNLNVKRAK